jgi:hypothetical protein
MANWTPEGFVGKSFQIASRLLPPPPGLAFPVLWGDEATVRQRLSPGTSRLELNREKFWLHYPFGPAETVGFFRQYFGPTQVVFSGLDQAGQTALAAQLEALWSGHNTATDGTTRVETEYLDVRAIRA